MTAISKEELDQIKSKIIARFNSLAICYCGESCNHGYNTGHQAAWMPDDETELLNDSCRAINFLQEQARVLQQYIDDLQSEVYINCAYCGHRYGPKSSTPYTMSSLLSEHIEKCEKHPLFIANKKIKQLEEKLSSKEKEITNANG